MMIILMVQLQSFQRLFLVLSVAPLGLVAWSPPCWRLTSPWASLLSSG